MIDSLLTVHAKDSLFLNTQVYCVLLQDFEVNVLVIGYNYRTIETKIVLLPDFRTISSRDYLTSVIYLQLIR